jgi:phosphoribosylformylglycinamidine cyclo-ligase
MTEDQKKGTTYADAGVDPKEGQRAVDLIKKKAEETFRFYPGKVITGIGGFSGLVELPNGMVMGFGTDGVGTKLIIAIIMDKHDTVGIDLGAMCFNDLAVAGITPVVFLDYIAMGKQIPERTAIIVGGIIRGCEMAKAALLGGEMAEMPGMYDENEYDLAGFAVGFANSKNDLILGEKVKVGMKVFGIPSSGIHSNGHSLVRKVTDIDPEDPEKTLRILETTVPGTNRTLGEELLEPTVIYAQEAQRLISEYEIAALIHISGGGWDENPPRVLPPGCAIKFIPGSWPVLPIFNFIQEKGILSPKVMRETFNLGIGLMAISHDDIDGAYYIGDVIDGKQEVFF